LLWVADIHQVDVLEHLRDAVSIETLRAGEILSKWATTKSDGDEIRTGVRRKKGTLRGAAEFMRTQHMDTVRQGAGAVISAAATSEWAAAKGIFVHTREKAGLEQVAMAMGQRVRREVIPVPRAPANTIAVRGAKVMAAATARRADLAADTGRAPAHMAKADTVKAATIRKVIVLMAKVSLGQAAMAREWARRGTSSVRKVMVPGRTSLARKIDSVRLAVSSVRREATALSKLVSGARALKVTPVQINESKRM